MQTVLEILDKCADYFLKKGVPNAKVDAQTLLASVLGCKRLELFLRFDQPLTQSQISDFRELVKRRAKREPLQHILGEVEFFGLKLRSDSRALIPRFETEELCEIAATTLFPDHDAPIRILDLGTGSGAIACALASVYANAEVVAADKSQEALSLARENVEANSLKNVSLLHSDWFSNVSGRFDLIAANPPYLSEEELLSAEPEVRQFDPRSALVSGESGMADLRLILREAPNYLTPKGSIICECGIEQPSRLADEFSGAFQNSKILPDSSRRARFIVCGCIEP